MLDFLKKCIHKMYSKDRVTDDIFTAVARQLEKYINDCVDLKKQLLTTTMTWLLSEKEKEYGLPALGSDASLRVRRNRLRNRMLHCEKPSVSLIENMLSNYNIGGIVEYADGVVTIKIKGLGETYALKSLSEDLKAILPAHISWEYRYINVTYKALEKYKYEELENYKYTDLMKGVIESEYTNNEL